MTSTMKKAAKALEHAGHPVVRIVTKSFDHLGQEFFRFEMETAIAGSCSASIPSTSRDVEFGRDYDS